MHFAGKARGRCQRRRGVFDPAASRAGGTWEIANSITGMVARHGVRIRRPTVSKFSLRRRYRCGAEALNLLQRLLHIHRQSADGLVGGEGRGGLVQQFPAACGLKANGGIKGSPPHEYE